MELRWANVFDRDDIIRIVKRNFGDRKSINGFMDIRDFVVAVDDGRVIGLSGIERDDKYIPGWELHYTCVDREYRGQGVCKALVMMVLAECKNRGISRLYWSAWRVGSKDLPNAFYAMKALGFKEAICPRVGWAVGFNCDFTKYTCVECTGDSCRCFEDLWYIDLV